MKAGSLPCRINFAKFFFCFRKTKKRYRGDKQINRTISICQVRNKMKFNAL